MKKALIIADVQNDFCPGGNLEVKAGFKIIDNINKLSNSGKFNLVVATKDWHPPDHISFASQHVEKNPFDEIELPYGKQTLWPDHCIQGKWGSEFNPALDMNPVHFILRKGYRENIDSYSAFLENDKVTETGLFNFIPITYEVYIVGIAFDVCVKATALDAVPKYHYVYVIKDACAGLTKEGVKETLVEFDLWGVKIITVGEII